MIPTVDITFAIAEPRYAQKNAMRKQDSVIWPEQCKWYRKLLLHNQEGEKIAGMNVPQATARRCVCHVRA